MMRAMAESKESRWIAAMTVAACMGVSIYLITGERSKGAAVAVLLAVVLTLVVVLSPANRVKSTTQMYLFALVALFGPLLFVMMGYRGRGGPVPWDDLLGQYAARGRGAEGHKVVGTVVVKRSVGQFMVQPQQLRGIETTLAEDGVRLAPRFPLSMTFDPVFVPLGSIRRCRRESLDAALSLREMAVEIAVADADGQVRAWCRRHEIPDGSEERRVAE